MPGATRRNRHGDTPPPHTGSSEAEVLRGFLDHLRGSLAAQVDGAPESQVRAVGVPSGTNLLGLPGPLDLLGPPDPRGPASLVTQAQ